MTIQTKVQTKEVGAAVKEFKTEFLRGKYAEATEIASKNGLTNNELPRQTLKEAMIALKKARRKLQNPAQTSVLLDIEVCSYKPQEGKADAAQVSSERTIKVRKDICYDLFGDKILVGMVPGERTRTLMLDIAALVKKAWMIGGWMDNSLLVQDSVKLIHRIREGIVNLPADDGTRNNRELVKDSVKNAGPIMDLIELMGRMINAPDVKDEERPSLWKQLRNTIRDTKKFHINEKANVAVRTRELSSFISSGPIWFDGTEILRSLLRDGNIMKLWRDMPESPLFCGEHTFSKSQMGLEAYARYQSDVAKAFIDCVDYMNKPAGTNNLLAGVAKSLYYEAVAARVLSIRHAHDDLRRTDGKPVS